MPKKYDPTNQIPAEQKISVAITSIKNELEFIDKCKTGADVDAVKRSIRGNINIILDSYFSLPDEQFKAVIGKIAGGFKMIEPMIRMLGIGK